MPESKCLLKFYSLHAWLRSSPNPAYDSICNEASASSIKSNIPCHISESFSFPITSLRIRFLAKLITSLWLYKPYDQVQGWWVYFPIIAGNKWLLQNFQNSISTFVLESQPSSSSIELHFLIERLQLLLCLYHSFVISQRLSHHIHFVLS